MTTTLDRAYHWTNDKSRICAELAKRRADLAICLITKDDPYFLERWITHHANIVGLRNLVIFDNMSTREDIWNIYAKYQGELLVVQIDGFFDHLHQVATYRELYEALKQATVFFTFLDTDEALVLVDKDRFHADASIVEFIQSCGDVTWLPATWLHNALGSEDLFVCGREMSRLVNGLEWGKPIVRAKAVVQGFILHNRDLNQIIPATRTHTNLFVLHRKDLWPEQRIARYMDYLFAYCRFSANPAERNFVSEGDDLQTILAKEIDHLPWGIRFRVSELRRLAGVRERRDSPVDSLEAGHVRFCPDGKIEYYSDMEKEVIRCFLADPEAMTQRAFKSDPVR
jgi:hypothetical protein